MQPLRQARLPLKHHRCMRELSVESVLAAVKGLIDAEPAREAA